MLPWGAPLPLAGPVSGPPQWIEPIADDTVSNVATYDLVWTGDYAAVLIDVHDMIPATNNVIAQLRTTGDGGATWDAGASDYLIHAMSISATNLQRFTQNANNPNMALHAGANQASNIATGRGFTVSMTILRPFDPVWTEMHGYGGYWGNSGPGASVTAFSGMRKALARVDGVRFYFTAGNIASGRFRSRGIIGYGEAG